MADTLDLGSSALCVQVQVLSPAPFVGDKTTQCHSMIITEGCVQAKVLSTSVSLEVDRL